RIDTGSQLTVLATAAVHAMGVTQAALSRDRSLAMQGVAGDPLSSRIHRFSKLQLGNVVVPNSQIVVADLALREADLVMGVDLLPWRRFWLPYGSRKIFISTPYRKSAPTAPAPCPVRRGRSSAPAFRAAAGILLRFRHNGRCRQW